MKEYLLTFFISAFSTVAFAQCLTVDPVTTTDVSCFGGSDGQISINVATGVAPYTFELILFRPGFGSSIIGSVSQPGPAVTFRQGNGSLLPPFEPFGVRAISNYPAGSEYRVNVSASGTSGNPFCEIVNITGIMMNQPTQLVLALDALDPDCNGAAGVGNGMIDVSVAGGTSPYTIQWSGPTAVPDGTEVTASNLDAGTYTIDVTDAKGCTTSLNVDLPVTTLADAGAASGFTCGTNSFVLSGNAPGAGETGTWTGPVGVTFSPDANTPNATANNLTAGGNTLRWTIVDAGGVCPGSFDEIVVSYSPAIVLSTTVTDVLCQGATTGAIDLNVSGGIAPYTFVWSDGSVTEDINALPAGTYSVTVTDAVSCSAVLSNITVNEPAAVVSGTTSLVHITCFGASTGSITITGAGGIAPFDFSVDGGASYPVVDVADNTFSTLAAGDYNLRVRDANGCESAVIPVTLTQPAAAVNGTTTQVDVTCFGASTGSITITGTGGVAPYDFSIDGGGSYPALDAPDQTFPNLVANTYDLKVRDANGCESAVIQVTITQPAAAVSGSTTQVDVFCIGQSSGSITITGSGGVGPYDFSIDNGATYPSADVLNHTFSNLAAGDYDLKVRDANGCESATISVSLTQPGTAVSGSTTQTDITCFGASSGSIAITGAGGVGPYDFSIDGGVTYSVSGVADNTFPGLPAGDYDLRVRDANGCESALIEVTLTQPASAVSASTSQVDLLCFAATTGSITVTGAGGVAPYDFSIDGGATYPVLDAADNTFSGLPAGDYDVVVRDANACETAIILVSITGPAAAVSGTTTQVDVSCFGASTGSITITGTGGVGPYDFSIDGGATFPALAVANHSFTGLAAGDFDLIVRDANGCASPVINVTITQPASSVDGNISQVNVDCFGASSGSIDVMGTGGVSPYDFSIDGGSTYPVTGVAAHTFSTLPAGGYQLVIRDANGCESAAMNVTITQPSAVVSGTTAQTDVTCFGASTGSITITGAGGVGPYDFSIDGGSTYPVSGVANTTFSSLAAGDYDLMVRDANGCVSILIEVTLAEPVEVTAVASAIGPVVVCEGATLPDVVFTFTGVAPFDFTYNGASGAVNIIGHPTNTFTIPTAPEGTYSVTALSDNNGCASANLGGSIAVIEETAAIAEAGNPQSVCSGVTATLTGSSVSGVAATGAWSIESQPAGGDGLLSDETQTASPDLVTFTASIPGDYTLRLTTDDPASVCNAETDDVIVTVTSAATVDAVGPTIICVGQNATVTATFTSTSGVTWTSSGDGSFDDPSLTTAVYTPGATDVVNGTVTLKATTLGPCLAAEDILIVTINAVAAVEAGLSQTICSNASIVLNASFSGSATGLSWTTNGDGSFDDVTDPNAAYTPGTNDAVNGSVTLTATATGSCAGITDNVTITINPAAIVDAGSPQTVCYGSDVTLAAVLGGSAASLTWTTSGDGSFSSNTDPAAVYTPGTNDRANGTVTLTATTNNPTGPCPAANDAVVITLIPTPGDQTTAGNETWIGYVYDDAGDTGSIPGKIDFANAKYRGFIAETDMASMSATSNYNSSTDAFDLNLNITTPLQGTNLCGPYLNNFSVRYLMDKTFAAGIYRFTAGADDGVRLLIDGVNVLPASAFDFQSYTTYTSAPICISAGVHQLEIHYFDNTAQSRLTFDYEAVPALTVTTPVSVCVNSPAPILTVASTDAGVVDFNWYKGGVVVFTGNSYTPATAELDMAAAGTTTFSVTAAYACGETQPVDVVVNVLNNATLTLDPGTICESGGIVDLLTLVDAVPPGGTFAFSGHPNITGNNFDPAGLSGSTISILVDYSNGSCVAPQGTLDLTITNTATITVPASAVPVCENSSMIDLTTHVTAVPSGGIFTFAGTGVTGNSFDPSGLSGPQPITVDYSVGGCVAAQTSYVIDVTATATLNVNNTTACESGSPINLLTRVSGSPSGGTFTFAGTGVFGNLFDPSGLSGTVSITVDYDLNGCTDNDVLQIDVLDASNPVCTGGNCASVVIVPKTEPATCTNSDGRLVMSLKPFTPAVNNTGIRITIDGTSSTGLPITYTIHNDSIFENLPVGAYNYTIEYGDPSCIKTGTFSIDQSGTVGTPVVSNLVSPACFGASTGSLTLDVPGETGNILEWSLDGGITDPFKPFTAGGQISGLPAGPPPSFQQVISVRRNIADVCYSSVTVTIPESVSPITATFGITPATCNGADGAITNIVAAGGNDAPFTYSIDGGQTFQAGPDFNNLAGGSYTLKVRDAGGCDRDFTADVTFPGFINSGISKINADCSNGGQSGSISVTVNDAGTFEVALTTDQFTPPSDADYLPYSNPLVTFSGLSRGDYLVYVRSGSGVCPTRSAPIRIFGVYDITFDLQPDCNNNELSLALTNVTGESGGAPLEIQVSRVLSSDPPEIIYQQFPADGEVYLDHDQYAFLQTPGEYRLKVIQFQNEAVCNYASETVDFTVPEPLTAQIGAVSESYPDIPTGELNVSAFSGGVFPFDVRIELDSAASFSLPYHVTEFEEAGLNGNQQIEMAYSSVPAGRYHVEVMDAQGCILDLIARVPLDVDLFIPNVFTPNGDGSNDVFFIRNLPQEPAANELIISNRWGKQVFVSENYQNNWDAEGTADGIYFYRLQLSDKDALTGWVEVIRGQKP